MSIKYDPSAYDVNLAALRVRAFDPTLGPTEVALAKLDLAQACHRLAEQEIGRLRDVLVERTAERDTARARVAVLEELKSRHWGRPDPESEAWYTMREHQRLLAQQVRLARRHFADALAASRRALKAAREWGRWQRALAHRAIHLLADARREST